MSIKIFKTLTIIILFTLFALIRIFENKLFYDPFLEFYRQIHYTQYLPRIELSKIVVYTFIRYFLNFIISITILQIVFKNKNVLKFSIFFYIIMFVILISLYILTLLNLKQELFQVFFYIRRFLIQPIFILLLLPAFYYQHKIQK